MAKKAKFIVVKEADIHSNGFKLEIRNDTPNQKLKEFYDKFNERNPEFVALYVCKVEEDVKEEVTAEAKN